MTYCVLRRSGMPYIQAVCIPLLIGTLPASEVYVAWSICAFFPWACIISGFALILADSATRSLTGSQRLSIHTAVLQIVGAVLLEWITLMIYQPAGMIFWLFAGILLFVAGAQQHLIGLVGKFALFLGVSIAAFGLEFVSLRIIPAAFYGQSSAAQRTALVQDIPGKIYWFFTNRW